MAWPPLTSDKPQQLLLACSKKRTRSTYLNVKALIIMIRRAGKPCRTVNHPETILYQLKSSCMLSATHSLPSVSYISDTLPPGLSQEKIGTRKATPAPADFPPSVHIYSGNKSFTTVNFLHRISYLYSNTYNTKFLLTIAESSSARNILSLSAQTTILFQANHHKIFMQWIKFTIIPH